MQKKQQQYHKQQITSLRLYPQTQTLRAGQRQLIHYHLISLRPCQIHPLTHLLILSLEIRRRVQSIIVATLIRHVFLPI